MRSIHVFILSAVLVLVAFASFAAAQDNQAIDAQMFRPSIFNGNFLAIEDAHMLDKMCYGFGLYFNYASRVVEIKQDTDEKKNERAVGILNSVTTMNLNAAFSPFDFLGIGVDVPYHVQARARSYEDLETEVDEETGTIKGSGPLSDNSALGDIMAEMKIALLQERKNAFMGIAIAGFATFPTGDPDIFLGEGTTNFGGKLMLEKDFKLINVGANGGYLVRPTRTIFGSDVGNAYLFGLGISREIVKGLSFSVEYYGQQYVASGSKDVQVNPMEAIGTLRYKFGNGLRLVGGGGAGTTTGIGAPAWRGIGGIDYYPHCEGPTQGKLIVHVTNEAGVPVKAAMKMAGPSGTLKPKNAQAKKFNMVTDDDGEYKATMDPGEYAMVAGAKGYLPTPAKGTVLIGKTEHVYIKLKPVQLPTNLKVKIVYKKNQQPIDTAALLIKDTLTNKLTAYKPVKGVWGDKFEPGTYVISAFAPGFERVDQTYEVIAEQDNELIIPLRKIIIQIGRVQFDYNSDVIKTESYPILEDVLKKIKQQNEEGGFKKLIIEGHASAEGTDEYNMNLTQRRAESVRKWLMAKTIPGDKLEPIGYGESRPIADNETEEGRIQNRRVEFIFEEDVVAGADAKDAKKEETKKDETKKDEPKEEPKKVETPPPAPEEKK